MTTLADMVVAVVGVPPVGWEFVPYLIACMLSIVGIYLVYSIISIPLQFLRR